MVVAVFASATLHAEELVPEDPAPPTPSREGVRPPWETVGKTPEPLQAPTPAQNPAAAAPLETTKPRSEPGDPRGDGLRFFFNIGAGYGYVAYDPYYQAVATSQSYLYGSSYAICSDEGFYLSLLGPNTLTGISVHNVTDIHFGGSTSSSFSSTASSGTYPFVFEGNIAASFMHFFGEAQASGFYLRGDAGYAVIGAGTSANIFNLSSTASGIGLLGGLGYSFRLGKHVRMLLGGQATTILLTPDGSPLSSFQGDFSFLIGF